MKPGDGETLAIFDNIREITTIELGQRAIGIENPDICRARQLVAHSESSSVFRGDKIPVITPIFQRQYMPQMSVSEHSYSEARASLEAVMSLDGIKGAVAKITGRKRLANNMLELLSINRANRLK